MSLGREEVARAARLARIGLSVDELDELTAGLSAVLDQLDVLRDAVASAAQPAAPAALYLPPSDEPAADPLHEPPSDFAPQWHSGYFMVPRVITRAADE